MSQEWKLMQEESLQGSIILTHGLIIKQVGVLVRIMIMVPGMAVPSITIQSDMVEGVTLLPVSGTKYHELVQDPYTVRSV